MGLDWHQVAVGAAIAAFNVPILFGAILALTTQDLRDKVGEALKEKTPDGSQADATSYSRIVGAIGATMVASLFWVICNIAVVTAILHPQDLPAILGGVGKLFLVGAALFLPYAFNQLKSVLQ